ncbi:unnamed protein product [Gongylonema pulchrum]|uniref:Uncharacterized protein n=1 Tax=Gongylonema pulchrum TaxID=637853 RepID=A0A183DWT7_9BILA|nr:unnamed protein product [Gongylonema pulchrum]
MTVTPYNFICSESRNEPRPSQPIEAQPYAYFNPVASRSQVPGLSCTTAARQTKFDCLRRDYSIDSQTDRLFQEFIRVDPFFETHSYNSRRRSGGSRRNTASRLNGFPKKHRTLDIDEMRDSNRMPIPLIYFSEDLPILQNDF